MKQGGKGRLFLTMSLASIYWSVKAYGDYMDELDLYNFYVEEYEYASEMFEFDLYSLYTGEYEYVSNIYELETSRQNMETSRHNLQVYRGRYFTALRVSVFIYLLNLNDIASYFDEPEGKKNFRLDISSSYNHSVCTLTCSYYF